MLIIYLKQYAFIQFRHFFLICPKWRHHNLFNVSSVDKAVFLDRYTNKEHVYMYLEGNTRVIELVVDRLTHTRKRRKRPP